MRSVISPLQEKGYLVPGIEDVGTLGPDRTELRYFREEDRDIAETVARVLVQQIQITVNVVRVPPAGNTRPQHLELWCGQSW